MNRSQKTNPSRKMDCAWAIGLHLPQVLKKNPIPLEVAVLIAKEKVGKHLRKTQIRCAIRMFCRYGELLTYDKNTDRLSLTEGSA